VSAQVVWTGKPVHSWAQFHRVVKRPERRLLSQLHEYEDSLLVAGCQRSGTTALTRLLKHADGIADARFGVDDELDGALLLAGQVERLADGRHCFQTTYLNDRYPEYFDHDRFRLLWILREPRSVIRSMLHNWKRAALNRLYAACGAAGSLKSRDRRSFLGQWIGPSRLEKACASYIAKTTQPFVLREQLERRMLIVDYDDLVEHREALLPRICEFAGVPFEAKLLDHLHKRSLHKGDKLPEWQVARIDAACSRVYADAKSLCTIGERHGYC
jgi:hypothetical protein